MMPNSEMIQRSEAALAPAWLAERDWIIRHRCSGALARAADAFLRPGDQGFFRILGIGTLRFWRWQWRGKDRLGARALQIDLENVARHQRGRLCRGMGCRAMS